MNKISEYGLPVIAWFLVTLLTGWLLEYSVETWVSYIKEVQVDVPYWACYLAAFFTGPLIVPVAAITFLVFLVL